MLCSLQLKGPFVVCEVMETIGKEERREDEGNGSWLMRKVGRRKSKNAWILCSLYLPGPTKVSHVKSTP